MAGKNGLGLLRELREFNNTTPAIIITAYTDTKHLKEAFENGAHDYIKKPFELDELNVRILNTKKLFHIDTKETIKISENILFCMNEKEVTKDDQKISLGNKDALLLSYFIKNIGRLIKSEELAQNIWDFDSLPSDATLRSHIRTLREVIGKDKIKTIRGEGYIYE